MEASVSTFEWVQVALLVAQPVLVAAGFALIRFNDLKHLRRAVDRIERKLDEHLIWHLDHWGT